MKKINFVTFLCVLFNVISKSSAQTVYEVHNEVVDQLDCPVIKTKLGDISGIRQHTVLGNNSFCSYRGIQYAEAPIGKLRFKAPIPSSPWKGVYNASEYGAACKRLKSYQNNSENCLFLNVFVPDPSVCSSSNDIAVIVYIHGGGFVSGAAFDNMYGPHLLLNKCIILVTLHYRLGAFGFLTLALPEYYGNMGLKDQQLALKWINEHISAFGGDSKRITLMGQSAGSVSVSFHRLNSKSRNLFKQAYAMSGTALSDYALSEFNNNTDLIVKLAKNQGIIIENSEHLINYIQTVDADYIVRHTSQFRTCQPCIEPKMSIDPFITEDPEVLLSEGATMPPTIYTYMTLESIAYSMDIIKNPDKISFLDRNFSFPLRFNGLDEVACKNEIATLFNEIRRFYFGSAQINASQILPYMQLISYKKFTYSVHREVALQALSKSKGDIRLLRLNQRTALNSHWNTPEVAALASTGHGDDICHYFWCESKSNIYREIETQETLMQRITLKTSEILREILTNFAITGNPVSETASFNEFPSINSEPLTNLPFTELLSVGSLASGTNPEQDEFKFWWSIEQKVDQIKKMSCNLK